MAGTYEKYRASNQRNFINSLRGSKPAVRMMAGYFAERGHDVEEPATSESPRREDWAKQVDRGDLFVNGQRVEVKHWPERTFTCARDFPFKRLMICNKLSWNRADPKPVAYYIVNAPMTHAAIVLPKTRPHWELKTWVDKRYVGVLDQECYTVGLEHVIFTELWGLTDARSAVS